MSKSSSAISNIIQSKCPKCREGYLFEERNPYKLSKLFLIKDKCDVCNQSFAPEPRFYEGAMYVSYAFSVALVVSIYVGSYILFDDPDINIMTGLAISIAFLMSPITLRLSRTIWIHIFVGYDKEAKKNTK